MYLSACLVQISGDGDTNRHKILRHGTYWSLTYKSSLLGTPSGPKSQILTANISKMVSRNVTCQIGRNNGSTRAFQKCIAWDSSPQRSPLKGKICIFCLGQISHVISVKMCMMVELCPIRGFLHFWWQYL